MHQIKNTGIFEMWFMILNLDIFVQWKIRSVNSLMMHRIPHNIYLDTHNNDMLIIAT